MLGENIGDGESQEAKLIKQSQVNFIQSKSYFPAESAAIAAFGRTYARGRITFAPFRGEPGAASGIKFFFCSAYGVCLNGLGENIGNGKSPQKKRILTWRI